MELLRKNGNIDKAKLRKKFHSAIVKLVLSEKDFLVNLLRRAIEENTALKFTQFLYEYIFNDEDIKNEDLKKIEVIINSVQEKKRNKEEIFAENGVLFPELFKQDQTNENSNTE